MCACMRSLSLTHAHTHAHPPTHTHTHILCYLQEVLFLFTWLGNYLQILLFHLMKCQ